MSAASLIRRVQGLQKLQATLRKTIPRPIRSGADVGGLPLLDFVPEVTPRWERPSHLHRVASLFERVDRGESVRAGFSAPPQHGKTELTLHAIAWLLKRHPDWPIGFVTYGQKLTNSKSRLARDYALKAGVTLRDDSSAVSEWRTVEGGGLLATSIGGALTGQGLKVLFLDDPYKDRKDAESESYRDRVDSWLSSVGEPRVHPGGSIIVSHTRWHDDDQIGRLGKMRDEEGEALWESLNIPAIDDAGEPLWHQRPLEFLARKRAANEFDWWSLWMGNPRPRGGGVFRDSYYFEELPTEFRIGKGLDCAYTKSTRADASVGLVMVQSDDKFYILDVRSKQAELDQFIPELRIQSNEWPGPYLFATSSTEKGIAQFSRLLPEGDIRIRARRAMVDKFTRAQPLASKWNAKKVLVPGKRACEQLQARGFDTSWVQPFVRTMNRFTGVGDKRDDEVDAAINAFDTFPRESTGGASGGGFRAGVSVDDLSGGYE